MDQSEAQEGNSSENLSEFLSLQLCAMHAHTDTHTNTNRKLSILKKLLNC